MVQTRRRHIKSRFTTIPMIRQSFEHIEKFVDGLIAAQHTKKHISKLLKKEWYNTFHKKLKHEVALEFISRRMGLFSRSHTHRRKKYGAHGGVAPIDSVTRPGIYLTPGADTYGEYVPYNKSISPIPMVGRYMSGGRRTRFRKRGGGLGTLISQAFMHPINSTSVPPSIPHDIQTMTYGISPSPSPQSIQNGASYNYNIYPKPVSLRINQ
jgi:hypothetical protein